MTGKHGRKCRVLIVAHSGVLYSGNAEVIRNIFLTLLQEYSSEYEVKQVGLVHVSAIREVPWEIIPTKVVGSGSEASLASEDLYGEETLDHLLRSWNPDLVFIHNDPEPCLRQLVRIGGRARAIAYLSIDGKPLPSMTSELAGRALLVTMSDFSRLSFIEQVGIVGAHMLVMCAPVDVARFLPVNRERKTELRRNLAPDLINENIFVLGWVGRNQWRKQLWLNYQLVSLIKFGNYKVCLDCRSTSQFDTLDRFCKRCGSNRFGSGTPMEDVVLWIHIPTGGDDIGWDLSELERYYNLERDKDVFYTDGCDRRTHLSPENMPRLFQMWDLLLFLSGGEGFGMPALEAMSCGLPIVYSDYSSHAEWIKKANAGIPVSGILQPEFGSSIMRMVSDIYSALDAVLMLKHNSSLASMYGTNGRAFAETVSVGKICDKWVEIFRSAQF